MSLSPVAFIAPNYRDYKGWWLKFYSAGTTTPKTIILNSGGTTSSASKLQLNQDGFITSSGGTIVVPYITGAYDAYLFPTAAEADANNTTQAVRVADGLTNELASSVVVFDNVAEMKAAALNIGQAAMCKRYYADGDLVDGLVYEIQASAAVDGFIDHALSGGNVARLIRNKSITARQAGAVGDGIADDASAIRACVDSFQNGGTIYLGSGKFFIGSTIRRGGGIHIIGEGVLRDYLYLTTNPVGSTEVIIADGITGFTSPNVVNGINIGGSFKNIGFRAQTIGSSPFGTPPNFSAGTVCFDIIYLTDLVIDNVDFTCFDKAVTNTVGVGGQESARLVVSNFTAQDCNYVFDLQDGAADVTIRDCPIALHCGYFVNCISVDGVRIEDVRFFQCYNKSVYIEGSQFTNIVGATLFETLETQCELVNCTYVTIAGCFFSRAGWYGSSISNIDALVITNCDNVNVHASIERPGKRGVTLTSSACVTLDVSIQLPFNGFGSTTLGAIDINGSSKRIAINAAITCAAGTNFALNAFGIHREEISGNISTNGQIKNAPRLDGNVLKENVAGNGVSVGAGGSVALETKTFIVPANRNLVIDTMEYDSINGLTARVNGVFYTSAITAGEMIEDTTRRIIGNNLAGSTPLKVTVVFYVHNPTLGAIAQEAGSSFNYTLKYIE